MRTRIRWCVAVAAGVLLAGCGGGEDEAEAPTPASQDDAEETADDAEADTSDEDAEVPGDADDGGESDGGDGSDAAAGSYTEADIGTGSLVVEGTVYEGFGGSCDVSKDFGASEVLDPSAEDVVVQIGIDNTTDPNPEAIAFEALNNRTFELRGAVSGDGTFATVQFGSPPTPVGSVDLTQVVFIGTLEDGTGVSGEVVCVVAKP